MKIPRMDRRASYIMSHINARSIKSIININRRQKHLYTYLYIYIYSINFLPSPHCQDFLQSGSEALNLATGGGLSLGDVTLIVPRDWDQM